MQWKQDLALLRDSALALATEVARVYYNWGLSPIQAGTTEHCVAQLMGANDVPNFEHCEAKLRDYLAVNPAIVDPRTASLYMEKAHCLECEGAILLKCVGGPDQGAYELNEALINQTEVYQRLQETLVQFD